MTKRLLSFFFVVFLIWNLSFPVSAEFFGGSYQIAYPKAGSENSAIVDEFNASAAYQHIQSQLNFGFRIPGSPGNAACRDWIKTKLANYSSVLSHNFTVDAGASSIGCENIIGKINPGVGNIVIFAAHFDTRAIAEKDPDPAKRQSPILGANDGGSGVAVLLELARVINTSIQLPKNEIWFVFFDAEDQGAISSNASFSGWDWCEGSERMAADMRENPSFFFAAGHDIADINAFILLDMVGGTDLQFIKESRANANLHAQIFESGRQLGYHEAFPLNPATYSIMDDHVPFANLGIPTVDLIIKFWGEDAAWPYHHTSDDTLAHIDPESLEITGKTLLAFLMTAYNSDSGLIPSFWDSFWFFRHPLGVTVSIAVLIFLGGAIFVLLRRKWKWNNADIDPEKTAIREKDL